jgi:4-amino-4-deoxy-L-arabinose transferase-like glycosyltransferase
MIKRLPSLKVHTWLIVVTIIAMVERIALYLLYRPVSYNDTASYKRLADAILAGWKAYDGTRTPGYPFFLALLGGDERVYAAQLFLGFLTTLLLFYVAWRISGLNWLAGLAALAHTLNPQQIFFEADLLTESLTTFLIILSIASLTWIYFSNKPALWKVLGVGLLTGLASGCAALTRPLFIFVPFWMAFFLVVFWHAYTRIRWGGALMIGLAGALVLGLWLYFIYSRFDMLSLTTMTGFHLVQHTGLFFEYVPDQYAVIRDVYLQYRAEQIATTGSPGNAIWAAIPALQQASGLNFYDLSRLLTKISIQLIINHPWLYLKNVILGWFWFWKAPVYYLADSFRFAWLGTLSKWINVGWRGALIILNIVFVSGSMVLVLKNVRRILGMNNFFWFLLGTIWLTSISQTLLDHGDNPRFLVPVQSLVVLVVFYWGTKLILFLRKKDANFSA